jgi:hypothetical protein
MAALVNSLAEKQQVVEIAGSFDKEVMTLLLERRGDGVPVTEEVVKAAAGNEESGEGVMTLLLKQRGDGVPIIEKAVKAVIDNKHSGY